MNHQDVRKGITNARFNEKNSGILFTEISIVSIAIGFSTSSWILFGVSLLGLILILQIKTLALILCIIFSIMWAVIGYYVGEMISGTNAAIVLAIIGLLAGLGANISALEWVKDIGK